MALSDHRNRWHLVRRLMLPVCACAALLISDCAHHSPKLVYANETLFSEDRIDGALKSDDQSVLDQVMPLLQPEERKNVIVIRTDDREIANRQAEQGFALHATLLRPEVLRFQGEPPFVPPPSMAKPMRPKGGLTGVMLVQALSQNFDTSTGAIHGHEIVNGYSALTADVILPCKAAKLQRKRSARLADRRSLSPVWQRRIHSKLAWRVRKRKPRAHMKSSLRPGLPADETR